MSEFRDHAYDRTIIATLQRVMLDRYIQSDTPPKESIVCEEVPRGESEIPQDALMRIFTKLQLWENDERQKMNEFRMVRVAMPPFLAKETARPIEESKHHVPERKRGRRRKVDESGNP